MLPGVYLSTMQVSAWFDRYINTERCCRIARSAINPPSKTTPKLNSNNSVLIYARAHEIAPSILSKTTRHDPRIERLPFACAKKLSFSPLSVNAQPSRGLSLGCVLLTSNATTVGKYRKGHVMMSTQSRGTNRIARTLQMEISLGKMKASLSKENADFQEVRE